MANTTLQNCQRIIIVMQFASLLLAISFLTIKLIKKKIDLKHQTKQEEPPSESAADKYKESSEVTNIQFDKAAIVSTVLQDDDTCTERLIKKICEFNVYFNPLLVAMPLNFVLGRSMAFSIVIYMGSLISCFIFNVFKVHRACVQNKFSRLLIQIIWIGLSVLMLINIWTTNASTMPYLLVQGRS